MKKPDLAIVRAAEVFEEMVSCRRMEYADTEFFRMPDVWRNLCDDAGAWKIKTYKSKETEDFKRKAGVIATGDRVTLTLDEVLFKRADEGCKLSNFILAHEFGHIALDHHANSKVTKNFQLSAGPNGMSNLPPTVEELEANYAAVFFQCGAASLDSRWDAVQLATRAFTDAYYVRKAQRVVRLEGFRRYLERPSLSLGRVIF